MAGSDRAPTSAILLEDDDLDAELIGEYLHTSGVVVSLARARTGPEYLAALDSRAFDIILSDFSLPGYDGLAALDAAQRKLPHVPFIFVSGAIGEERAIETLQRGAADCVLKDRLHRLGPAVLRALKLADERKQRLKVEAERDGLLVSERRARESAEAANRTKDEFLAVVSHELRTPLNAILGWAHLLGAPNVDRTLLATGIKTIERNARVQSRLIDDVLDISRIITGKLQLNASSVSVAAFVRAAADSVTPAARAKSIALRIRVDEVGDLIGDADRLQQVVWNLLSNAVKFTPAGGEVSVAAVRRAEVISITVTDTGIGIEPEFLPHVFERFRQSDASSTRRYGGLGLGLAIVRHLVELHGGTARAESEGAGRGSTIIIELPVGHAVATDLGPEASPSRLSDLPASDRAAPSLHGVHALVVDDEPDTRDLVALILRSSGATVRTAASAIEALDLFVDAPPDVIIADIGMPDIDGYSLMKRVRSLSAGPVRPIPAIALTAYAREVDRRTAEAAGYQRHLAKPVTPSALVRAVAEVIASSELYSQA